jgi:hypothetical protein
MHHASLMLLDPIMVSICSHVFVHISNRVSRVGKMYHIRVNIHPLIVCTFTMFKSQVANGGYFAPSDMAIE